MLTSSSNLSNKGNSSTISLSNFQRIVNTIVPSSREEDNRKHHDMNLKSTSQQKMRKWPDSIEMAKKNQLEVRKKVFFENEMEKRKIDEEERKFQEMQKKIIVERANKLLFEAQDPVKSFHSKLLVADVLKEREYQKDISERKKEIEREKEARWLEIEKEQMKEYDLRENMKKMEDKHKKEIQIETINSQFTDYKIKRVREYQDKVVEGELIKLAAKKALKEEKEKEEEKKSKAIEQQNQFKKANQELEELKLMKKQKEKEEEKKIEEFAIKKQQMADLRKRKEIEKFNEKQHTRQKLIDKQIEYLKSIKNREDEILNKQVKESEEKKARELEEKKRRFNELKKQIDDHRDFQKKRKKEIQEQEKKEDKEFVELWKEKMKQLVKLINILGSR
jgi:hypothetical protein